MTNPEVAEALDELGATPASEGLRPLPPRPVRLGDRIQYAVSIATKALIIAFGIDAFRNYRSRRLRGKAIRTRAIGYVGALFIVPMIWRLLPNRGRYPIELDLAVTAPLFLDAAGNAFGVYEKAHIDDAVHTINSAIVAGVAGALFAPHVDERWQAALAGAGVSVAAGSAWEAWEYVAWRLGANGMNLTYEDTMDDIIEGFVGAGVGALFALTRAPRSRMGRQQTGWRQQLGA
jgi:hypothetical protein